MFRVVRWRFSKQNPTHILHVSAMMMLLSLLVGLCHADGWLAAQGFRCLQP